MQIHTRPGGRVPQRAAVRRTPADRHLPRTGCRPAVDHRRAQHGARPRAGRHPYVAVRVARGRAHRRAAAVAGHDLQEFAGRAAAGRRQDGRDRRLPHPEDAGTVPRAGTRDRLAGRALPGRRGRRHDHRGRDRGGPRDALHHRSPPRRRRIGRSLADDRLGRVRGDARGVARGRPRPQLRRRLSGGAGSRPRRSDPDPSPAGSRCERDRGRHPRRPGGGPAGRGRRGGGSRRAARSPVRRSSRHAHWGRWCGRTRSIGSNAA